MALWEKIRNRPDPASRPFAEVIAASNGAGPRRVGYGDLLRILNRLATRGDVEKITLPDMRCRYWRLDPSAERCNQKGMTA